MDIRPTRHGLRLSQHGVVISELRTSPGPTHSVFDVLAALITILDRGPRLGVLGFAGGGMMAPLAALGFQGRLETVDLDAGSFQLFEEHCPAWSHHVRFHLGDAAAWLNRQRRPFDLLMDDLSIPRDGDVHKPAICWEQIPNLIRGHLKPGGVAIFNLLEPRPGRWNPEFDRIAARFESVRVVHFDEYENRILIAGSDLPKAAALSIRLRRELTRLRSRQATRIRVRAT